MMATNGIINNRNFGLIAGNGELPIIVAKELKKKNKKLTIFCFDDKNLKFFKSNGYNVNKIFIDKLADILDKIHTNKINNVVCCGGIKFKFNKKNFALLLKFNFKIITSLIKMFFSKQKGDNFLLCLAEKILNSIGCRVVGVQEIVPDLLCSKKDEVNPLLAKQYNRDIAYGVNILRSKSKYDIGQAIVVQNGRVLGIEAIEGTENLISRCSEYAYKIKKKPILIKISKVNQNKKLDVPSIGFKTIKDLIKYNYAGIAIEKSCVFIINKIDVIEYARKNHFFIKII